MIIGTFFFLFSPALLLNYCSQREEEDRPSRREFQTKSLLLAKNVLCRNASPNVVIPRSHWDGTGARWRNALGATPHSDKGVIGAGRNRRKRWMVGMQVGEHGQEQGHAMPWSKTNAP